MTSSRAPTSSTRWPSRRRGCRSSRRTKKPRVPPAAGPPVDDAHPRGRPPWDPRREGKKNAQKSPLFGRPPGGPPGSPKGGPPRRTTRGPPPGGGGGPPGGKKTPRAPRGAAPPVDDAPRRASRRWHPESEDKESAQNSPLLRLAGLLQS